MSKTKTTDRDKGFYIVMNEKVHKDFKVACVVKGVNMTNTLEEFMIKFSKK